MTGQSGELLVRLGRLADAARASETMHRDDVESRDDAIEQADQAGYKIREISEAATISTSHVHRIIMARTAARQKRLLDAVP